jgi:hypothetical protein
MNRIFATAVLAPAIALVSGCAIVRSDALSSSPGAEGIAYMLPHALLPVELHDKGGAFELSVQQPIIRGDPAKTYLLRPSGNAFSSDNVQVTVDAATGLLSAVNVWSDDQTLPTLVKLASRKATAESAEGPGPALVFRGLFDPDWSAEQIAAFNKSMNEATLAYLKQRTGDLACPDPGTAPCKKALALRQMLAEPNFEVASTAATPRPVAPEADCSVGICYRMNLPYTVRLSAAGVSNSVSALLPNGSPTFALAVDRWAFVKTSHNIALQNGSFQSLTSDRPSSALALAAAPVDAMKAVLGAVGEIVQLKVDLSGKEKALADARVAEIKAKADLDKALIDKGGAKAEAAVFGSTGSRDALVSIRVGEPAPQDALERLREAPPPAPAPAPSAPAGADGRTHPGHPGNR